MASAGRRWQVGFWEHASGAPAGYLRLLASLARPVSALPRHSFYETPAPPRTRPAHGTRPLGEQDGASAQAAGADYRGEVGGGGGAGGQMGGLPGMVVVTTPVEHVYDAGHAARISGLPLSWRQSRARQRERRFSPLGWCTPRQHRAAFPVSHSLALPPHVAPPAWPTPPAQHATRSSALSPPALTATAAAARGASTTCPAGAGRIQV